MNDKLHPALAEHAMEAELQLERERHRKTWRQLEQVTGLLQRSLDYFTEPGMPEDLLQEYRAALSQQAEPNNKCVSDGGTCGLGGTCQECPHNEPAPAQDERAIDTAPLLRFIFREYGSPEMAGCLPDDVVRVVRALEEGARPAQTEQQSIRLPERSDLRNLNARAALIAAVRNSTLDEVARLNAAPIAQTEQAKDEDAAFLEWANRAYGVDGNSEELNHKHRDVIENRKGWMARAALSTQGGE